MLAIHDHLTHQMRNHLKTTGMGLGLVRLLQDAGRTKEARTALCSLESSFQDVAKGFVPRELWVGRTVSGAHRWSLLAAPVPPSCQD
jgi:hypothetical protein